MRIERQSDRVGVAGRGGSSFQSAPWSGSKCPRGNTLQHMAFCAVVVPAHLNGARVQCGSTFLGHWGNDYFRKTRQWVCELCASPLAWLIWLCSPVGTRPDDWLRHESTKAVLFLLLHIFCVCPSHYAIEANQEVPSPRSMALVGDGWWEAEGRSLQRRFKHETNRAIDCTHDSKTFLN